MIVRWLKLLDTYLALILIQGFSVLGIFLVRQFLHSLPIDYIDAARIDGLNEFGIYYKIVLPLITPVLSALAIFSFRDSWGNLLWPVLTITSTEKYTLPVGIASLTTVLGPVMHLLLPAASTSVIPVMIVFFFFQSKIIEAVTSTGLKG
jgi:multiple sugar transport system permease protein